jgi:crossover junction endodeoxyribonuclease RusA
VSLHVYGVPQPKGNKSAFVRGGKAVLVEARRPKSRKAFAAWTKAVLLAAEISHVGPPLDGPLAVTAIFYLRRPKSQTKRERAQVWHTRKPDGEKLMRALLDPLTKAGVIADDARVCVGRYEKRYAELPTGLGAAVTIAQIAESE